MKHKETMVFTPEDIKEAILWLCRKELEIPDDYVYSRDVDIKITCPYSLNNVSNLEAVVSWEDGSEPNIPFPTTEEQKANLPRFLDKLLEAGIATDFAERVTHLAAIDQGMYELLELWVEHNGDSEAQEQDMLCIQSSLDEWEL